jgi:hypothetical protein
MSIDLLALARSVKSQAVPDGTTKKRESVIPLQSAPTARNLSLADLLTLARSARDEQPSSDAAEELEPVPDRAAAAPREPSSDAALGDLLTLARAFRGVSSSTIESASERGLDRLATSVEVPPPAVDPRVSIAIDPAAAARRCFTCGQLADGSYDDGSPRYLHGHDPLTGERWSRPRGGLRLGDVRHGASCRKEHAVGMTCAPAVDLVAAALAIFGDDVVKVDS